MLHEEDYRRVRALPLALQAQNSSTRLRRHNPWLVERGYVAERPATSCSEQPVDHVAAGITECIEALVALSAQLVLRYLSCTSVEKAEMESLARVCLTLVSKLTERHVRAAERRVRGRALGRGGAPPRARAHRPSRRSTGASSSSRPEPAQRQLWGDVRAVRRPDAARPTASGSPPGSSSTCSCTSASATLRDLALDDQAVALAAAAELAASKALGTEGTDHLPSRRRARRRRPGSGAADARDHAPHRRRRAERHALAREGRPGADSPSFMTAALGAVSPVAASPVSGPRRNQEQVDQWQSEHCNCACVPSS